MTDTQRKVLLFLRDNGPQAAARVGACIAGECYPGSTHPRSPQGLGRIGGATLRRLQDAGLVAWTWPTYRITQAGRRAVAGLP